MFPFLSCQGKKYRKKYVSKQAIRWTAIARSGYTNRGPRHRSGSRSRRAVLNDLVIRRGGSLLEELDATGVGHGGRTSHKSHSVNPRQGIAR